MEKKKYKAPAIVAVEFKTENGFAGSNPFTALTLEAEGPNYQEDTDWSSSANFGHSFGSTNQ